MNWNSGMHNRLVFGFLGGVFVVIAAITSASAEQCQWESLPIIVRVPYLLVDRKTGLMLYLESDRKHMSAIGSDGRVVWSRDIAAGGAKGVPPIPPEMLRMMHKSAKTAEPPDAYELGEIGGIELLPQCQIEYSRKFPVLRNHNVAVGFGTRAMGVLDAKTGDIQIIEIN